MNLSIEQFADICQGEWLHGMPDSVSGFAFDTRLILAGELFVALKSDQRDGHDFASVAYDKRAAALLVDHELDLPIPQLLVKDVLRAFQLLAAENRRQFKGKLIGVTGSCGKTSTKNILGHILGSSTLVTAGNFNNHIGVPLTLLQLDNEVHDFAVIEAGINHPGEMKILAEMIQPDLCIITNVSEAHLEGLKNIETIAEEKAVLAQYCSKDGKVFFPASCLKFSVFHNLITESCTVSFEPEVDDLASDVENYIIRVKEINAALQSCRIFIREAAGAVFDFELGFLSEGQQQNTALAVLAGRFLGIESSMMQKRLENVKMSAMRGEVKSIANCFFYVDCYNANPASMLDSCQAFQQKFPIENKIYVLACMNELGELSNALHERTAEKMDLAVHAKHIFIIGDQSEAFKKGLLRSGVEISKVSIIENLEAVVAYLSAGSEPCAVFLKGSRSYRLETLLEVYAEEVESC